MLKLKWLMITLSSTFLITVPTTSNIISFQSTKQLVENKVDLNGMMQTDKYGLLINPIQIQYEKDKAGSDRIKAEEQKRLQKQKEAEEQKRIEEENKKIHQQTFIVSYYGATYNECGNNHFITASGVPVQEGHIAVPKEIPFGSKIILNGVEYLATDRGNPNYIRTLDNGDMKVDVFISRLDNESTYRYEQRIAKMGIKKVIGELYIK